MGSPSPLIQLKKFLKGLTFSNKTTDGCLQILGILAALFQKENWSTSFIWRQLGGPYGFAALKILKKMERLHADCRKKSLDMERILELYHKDLLPEPFITGLELLSHGLKQGPVFSSVLSELYDIQLSDPDTDKKKLIDYLEKMKKNMRQ